MNVCLISNNHNLISTFYNYIQLYEQNIDYKISLVILNEKSKISKKVLDINITYLDSQCKINEYLEKHLFESFYRVLISREFEPDLYYTYHFNSFLLMYFKYNDLLNVIKACERKFKQITTIVLHSNSYTYQLELKCILYVENKNRNVILYYKGNSVRITENFDTIKQFLVLTDFIVPHASFIVNVNYIIYINKNSLILNNFDIIPIAHTKKKKLLEHLKLND